MRAVILCLLLAACGSADEAQRVEKPVNVETQR